MSMQDTLADMFTRIRNALAVAKKDVACSHTILKEAVAKVLCEQGYLQSYQVEQESGRPHKNLIIKLKYFNGKPVIEKIDRASRSSLRLYKNANDMPEIKQGLGIAVVTTSKGVMTARDAKKQNIGGEIICYVE